MNPIIFLQGNTFTPASKSSSGKHTFNKKTAGIRLHDIVHVGVVREIKSDWEGGDSIYVYDIHVRNPLYDNEVEKVTSQPFKERWQAEKRQCNVVMRLNMIETYYEKFAHTSSIEALRYMALDENVEEPATREAVVSLYASPLETIQL